jgi:hypothetical protein
MITTVARYSLKFPPDDIADWHQVPIPYQEVPWQVRLKSKTMRSVLTWHRFCEIEQWLRNETTGPYYLKSNCTVIGKSMFEVYCFRESTDAMMFAMLWS